MIIYDLACVHDHRFEGWFASPDDFAQQQTNGFLTCPQCNSSEVRRIPSAVTVGGNTPPPPKRREKSEDVANEQPRSVAPAAPPMPTSPLAMYRQIVSTLMAHSEDVGKSFAEEARKIHYDEAPARAIRGQTTAEEFAELQDEGIEVLNLPKLDKDDLN